MKKFLCALMMAVLALGITACGGAAEQSAPAPTAKTETAAPAADGGKKILAAYFSHTGNTEKVAQLIQSKTGADIFKIETATPYPSVYRETTELAKQEKADNARPALKNKVENMAQYDVVFVGYPIWWYTAPMAVATFADSYDFSGKTVITFCTSGGSPISDSTPDINKWFKGANVIEGIRAYPDDTAATEKWLAGLNL
ncbi:flavodoxin [Phascolarctobacterium faecium]|nr:flavodoxin [Phascolarctobacterium faecium]MDM8108534.1 flavodoxin [Phascolarctobacterium faecium]